ncbi:MAG: hypothetical protein VKL42_03845 [Snowella sp.]|nr:hypothetical protein [Snowella sp.]
MVQTVIAVDQVLTIVPKIPFQPLLQDYILGMVFANAAARASRNTITNSNNDAAQVFNNQWNNKLGQIGWTLTSAGSQQIKYSGSNQTTTIADSLVQQSGSDVVLQAINTLKSLTESNDSSAIALTEFWWEFAAQGQFMQSYIGQLMCSSESVNFEMFCFYVDLSKIQVPSSGFLNIKSSSLDYSSIKAIFSNVLSSSIDLTTYNLSAELQIDRFANSREELNQRIGAKLTDHYKTFPANLLQN